MSVVLGYRNMQPNQASFQKSGTARPLFAIDWTDGMASGVTLAACTVGAVNSSNSDVTASCVSGVTTTGALTTVSMLTCGTSGTSAAVDGAQFRLRVTQTLSDSRILTYDAFVVIDNTTYAP